MNEQGILFFVDDDPVVLETLELELDSDFGSEFHFETALNATEALKLIASFVEEGYKRIIVICDWLMPGMKGDEFLIEINQRWPEIKSIMLTGQANDEAVRRAKEGSRMNICMRKPWAKEDLVRAISSTLKNCA